jgi:CheY-like chemotaxis protein
MIMDYADANMGSTRPLKVFTVTLNAQRAVAFDAHFSSLGFEFQTTSDALYALTALERDQPDLIVCDSDAGGMSGQEFHEIVRSEPHLNAVVFVLLDATAHLSGSLDLMLPSDATPEEIAAMARTTLVNLGRLEPDRFEKGSLRSSSNDPQLTGTFEVLSLFDLIVSLTHGQKSGDLCIQLASAEAKITIRSGRVTHATYQGKVGEDALLLTFTAVEEDQGAEFVLRGLHASDKAQAVHTINTPIDQLLLKVAVGMDHHKKAERVLS